MNTQTLKGFRFELEKISARRGLKEIAKLLRMAASQGGEKGMASIAKADRLAKVPGVLKATGAGSQIKDLGMGAEGLATLSASPQHGVHVRKLYNPQGLASPEMIARKETAGKAMKGNQSVAQFYGSAKTPQGAAMHSMEYVPGQEMKGNLTNPAVRQARANALRAVRQSGFHGAQDVRAANMIKTPTGQVKTVDFLPSQRGEFERPSIVRRVTGGQDNIVAPTDKGMSLLQNSPGGPTMNAGQLKGNLFRGAAPKGPLVGQFKPLDQMTSHPVDGVPTSVQRPTKKSPKMINPGATTPARPGAMPTQV